MSQIAASVKQITRHKEENIKKWWLRRSDKNSLDTATIYSV